MDTTAIVRENNKTRKTMMTWKKQVGRVKRPDVPRTTRSVKITS